MSDKQDQRVVLFLDTSSLLHFRFPSEVDWCAELKCDRVLLVVAPVVVWELNEKKNSGRAVLKSRAEKVLRRLRNDPEHQADTLQAWADLRDVETANLLSLRPAVDIYLDPIEPEFDPGDRLSEKSQDDRLIASALHFFRANTNVRVEVRARDYGLDMKLRRFRIPVKEPPESALLPDEPDPDKQEIADLRKKVAELQAAQPKLGLRFRTDGREQREAFKLHIPRPPTPEEIEKLVERASRRVPHLPAVESINTVSIATALFTRDPPEKANQKIDAYNRQRDAYLDELKSLLQFFHALNRQFRCVPIRLEALNNGAKPAENIHLTLEFPEVVEVSLQAPPAPAIPSPPKTPVSDLLDGVYGRPYFGIGEMVPPALDWKKFQPPSFRRPKVKGNIVILEDDRLQHGFVLRCGLVYATFKNIETIRPFQVRYSFHADNLPSPEEGELTVMVGRVDDPDPRLPDIEEKQAEGKKPK